MTWRPLPGDGPGPRSVGESLDGFAKRLGVPQAGPLAAVFAHWEEIVGSSVAAHAKPVSVVKGALVVAVDQPGWATQLRYLGGRLVERIGEVAGEGVVDRLEVRVEGGARPSDRRR
jgi:predicted nucleic acid-binding Zn ribbon protein